MYEAFYQLKARPFQLSPDPRFFYGSPGHKRAMSYLRYGLTQGEGFIVITGEIGTGKTMLVRTLFADLAKENVVAAQLVTTQLEADDTLRMVAASFGLAHEGLEKATILKNLETFMMARAREGKRVLLLVDEAQNLPPRSLEELRMLSNFQLGGRVLFQSFLLGQAEFRNTLQSKGLEQLRQRVIAAYHLEPLDLAQTRAYVEHRLTTVGWKDDPKFADESFAVIHQHSGGIPRRINTLCDRLMLFGCLEEIHDFPAERVNTVIAELQNESAGKPAASAEEDAVETEQPVVKAAPSAAADAPAPAAPQTSVTKTAAPAAGAAPLKSVPRPAAAAPKPATAKPATAAAPNEVPAAAPDMETRIAILEKRVALLEEGLKRERARLRRAILLSDEFGGV
ncbi:MAG: XrtA/PEP-CTERM system-associated ATPase [Pseudomonadota bacterium]